MCTWNCSVVSRLHHVTGAPRSRWSVALSLVQRCTRSSHWTAIDHRPLQQLPEYPNSPTPQLPNSPTPNSPLPTRHPPSSSPYSNMYSEKLAHFTQCVVLTLFSCPVALAFESGNAYLHRQMQPPLCICLFVYNEGLFSRRQQRVCLRIFS